MNKPGKFEIEGEVIENLPGGKFKVKVILGDNEKFIEGHISGKMRLHYIRLIPGDKVKVEMSTYDISKGRIIYRA